MADASFFAPLRRSDFALLSFDMVAKVELKNNLRVSFFGLVLILTFGLLLSFDRNKTIK